MSASLSIGESRSRINTEGTSTVLGVGGSGVGDMGGEEEDGGADEDGDDGGDDGGSLAARTRGRS